MRMPTRVGMSALVIALMAAAVVNNGGAADAAVSTSTYPDKQPASSVASLRPDGTSISVGGIVAQMRLRNGRCVAPNGESVGVQFPIAPDYATTSVDLYTDGHCTVRLLAISHDEPVIPRATGGTTVGAVNESNGGRNAPMLTTAAIQCPHNGWSKITDLSGGVTEAETRLNAAWLSSGSDLGCYGTSVSSPTVVSGTKNTYCYGDYITTIKGCTYSIGNYAPTSLTFTQTGSFNTFSIPGSPTYQLVTGISNNYTYSGRFYSQCYTVSQPFVNNVIHCSAGLSY